MDRNDSRFVWDDGPVWQDDDEVDSCFLCHASYNFFKRRHHCRKCGRVVCGSCSDQTIKDFPNTIIVNGPGRRSRSKSYETYRTCDECVDEVRMIRRALFGDQDPDDRQGPSESLASSTSSVDLPISRPHESHSGHIHEPVRNANNPYSHDNSSTTKYTTRTNTRTVRSSTASLVNDTASTTDSDSNLCPVCATDLLKLYIHNRKKHIDNITNDDFESFKESHINDCLVAFDFNHDDNERFTSPTAHPRNKMLVYNMPPIPRPQYESIPDMGSSSVDTIPQRSTTDQLEFMGSLTSNSTIPPSAEKDAELDNECVICLEDLKPGDKVARLECLCVFHYKCIKFWFNKKGYGECPVHFLHK